MRIKLAFLVLAISLSSSAYAKKIIYQHKEDISVPEAKSQNLIEETQALSLQTEEKIQKDTKPSYISLGLLGGILAPTELNIPSAVVTTKYAFSKAVPVITGQMIHLPYTWHGRWGWAASIGYAYGEYDVTSEFKTALHLIPIQLNLGYFGEVRSTQVLVPYLMLGPTFWTYIQRGTDQYNTSGSDTSLTATGGLGIKLRELGLLDTRNDVEVLIQYQRQINIRNNGNNWDGNSIQIGGTLAL